MSNKLSFPGDNLADAEVSEIVAFLDKSQNNWSEENDALVDKLIQILAYTGFDIDKVRLTFVKRGKALKKSFAEIKEDIVYLIGFFISQGTNVSKIISKLTFKESAVARIRQIMTGYKIQERLEDRQNPLTIARVVASFPILAMVVAAQAKMRISPVNSVEMQSIKHITYSFFGSFLDCNQTLPIDREIMDNIIFVHLTCQLYNTQIFAGRTRINKGPTLAKKQLGFIRNAANSQAVPLKRRLDGLVKMKILDVPYAKEGTSLTFVGLERKGGRVYLPSPDFEKMADWFFQNSIKICSCDPIALLEMISGVSYSGYSGLGGYRNRRLGYPKEKDDKDAEEYPEEDDYCQDGSNLQFPPQRGLSKEKETEQKSRAVAPKNDFNLEQQSSTSSSNNQTNKNKINSSSALIGSSNKNQVVQEGFGVKLKSTQQSVNNLGVNKNLSNSFLSQSGEVSATAAEVTPEESSMTSSSHSSISNLQDQQLLPTNTNFGTHSFVDEHSFGATRAVSTAETSRVIFKSSTMLGTEKVAEYKKGESKVHEEEEVKNTSDENEKSSRLRDEDDDE